MAKTYYASRLGANSQPGLHFADKAVVMLVMKPLLFFVGIVAVLIGLVWIGQGSGYFPYPASSFMISQKPWMYYGAGLALAGLILIGISRRA